MSISAGNRKPVNDAPTNTKQNGAGLIDTDVARVRQKAQTRAERIWRLQRQSSAEDWQAFVKSHPDVAGWYDWLSDESR